VKPRICLALCAVFLLAATRTTGAPFPDEWYFPSNRGGKGLRVLEGRPAPSLSLSQWEGRATTLADSRGKVIVLDFWATWCGPCIASLPKNIELVKSFKDRGLVFIGVHAAGGGWDKAPAMVSARGLNYPVALDDGGATTKAYGVRAFPTYVVIDRSGVVRAAGLLPDKVKQVVTQLAGETVPGATDESVEAEFADDWFYGGAGRPVAWRSQEGKPARPIRVAEWAGETPDTGDRLVRVLQFTRPELGVAREHLAALGKLSERYGSQGVRFTAVCDARADWQKMKQTASQQAPNLALALDRPVLMSVLSDEQYAQAAALVDKPAGGPGPPATAGPGGRVVKRSAWSGPHGIVHITTADGSVHRTVHTSEPSSGSRSAAPQPPGSGSAPREAGVTARAYGIRIAPVTVVIDRSGKIRATGLKLERLKAVLDKLLAEPFRDPPAGG